MYRGKRFIYKAIYNLLFHLALPILLLIQIIVWVKEGTPALKRLKSRLVFYPALKKNSSVVWFHGASLGEVLALIPLMERLREDNPEQIQVLSVNTVRGEYVALKKSPADKVIYLPLDLSYIVKRALRRLHPSMIIILETEIWPQLFWQAAEENIPVVLVSGRISTRSFPRYKLLRGFFSNVLARGHFLMRTQGDAQRLTQIGAPVEAVHICGDIKYDGLKMKLSAEEKKQLEQIFSPQGPVIVAGSTHAGEEKIILEAFKRIKEIYPKAHLIIAPRHLKRANDVSKLIENTTLTYERRSETKKASSADIFLLDSYGELSFVYELASLVFIGGTLVEIGGHNVMEPAAFGKPVLCGPYYANFRRHVQSLQEQDSIIIIDGPDELFGVLFHLLSHPKEALAMAQRGQEVVFSNQGALGKCQEFLYENFISKNID